MPMATNKAIWFGPKEELSSNKYTEPPNKVIKITIGMSASDNDASTLGFSIVITFYNPESFKWVKSLFWN
jgi:hypothetical protein